MPRTDQKFKTLKEGLINTYRVDHLNYLGKQISTKLPSRKAELVDHIECVLFGNLEQIVGKLNKLGVSALAEAVYNWNGAFQSKRFFAKYGASPTDRAPGEGYGDKPDILELFFVNGLIPTDLHNALMAILTEPKAETMQYSSSQDLDQLTVRETEWAAAMNLNMFIEMINRGDIKVSAKTGRPTAATIKKIRAILYDGDFYENENYGTIQAFAWPMLLQGGGLAALNGNALKLTAKGQATAKSGLAQGIKTIWKKWEKTTLIDEFSRIPIIKGQQSAKGRAMTSPVRRRPLINKALTHLEVGRWVSVDEISRYIRSEDLDFSMTNYDWKLYIGAPDYGNLSYYDTWPLLQLRYLLVYFLEYCATLGILDVAYEEPEHARSDFGQCWGADDHSYLSIYDGLRYIRLNALGAYTLGLSKNYGDIKTQEFAISDTTIRYTGKGSPSVDISLYLDKIADRKEATQWHISESTLAHAIKNGEKLKDIRTFLNKISTRNPGKVMVGLLDEMTHMASAVVNNGPATLLECHPQTRTQILSNRKLNRLCLPAGDRHIIVLPEKEELFFNHLESLGIIVGSK